MVPRKVASINRQRLSRTELAAAWPIVEAVYTCTSTGAWFNDTRLALDTSTEHVLLLRQPAQARRRVISNTAEAATARASLRAWWRWRSFALAIIGRVVVRAKRWPRHLWGMGVSARHVMVARSRTE